MKTYYIDTLKDVKKIANMLDDINSPINKNNATLLHLCSIMSTDTEPIALPFPSLNGWAIFISTYFSTISSNVDWGILSIAFKDCLRYITGANLKLPLEILTSLNLPAKS